MGLLDKRLVYAPFEYEQAYDFWEKQQQAHWLHTEIPMSGDISDWKSNMTETEKTIIGNVLKGFTQSELVIEDYWSTKVAKWFPKPEIQMMANTMGAFESIHAVSYAYLNDSLGLDDYAAFLHEPSAKAKIDRLMLTPGDSLSQIALSLAVFSAFNEGVNLFSSFAVLMNFSRFNKLKGLGQIISFSIRDESLHSNAGCWLFRTFVKENPGVFTDELKAQIYEAARITVKLEDDFLDMVFSLGNPEGLTKEEMKNYIRHRANEKLIDLGLKTNWKNIDKEALDRMQWFEVLGAGVEMQDFFAGRVSTYSRGTHQWDSVWGDTHVA
jgi:ribonucleoside-diphosphate reductase beta chain